MRKKRHHSIITIDDILRAVRIFRYVTRFILLLFFTGGARRIKALEKMLPALEREGRLHYEWHRGEKVYSIPREKRVKPVSMDHELACALILVLLWRCRMEEGEIVPERAFRGFGVVPEGAIRYSKERNTMIVIEYETNKDHKRATKSKITRYIKYLPLMEAKFQRRITVLFVLDIDRPEVIDFVKRMEKTFREADFSDFDGSGQREDGSVADGDPSAFDEGDRFPLDPFFFTDFKTLKSVSGNLLKAKIYFWNDGNEWSLSSHD
jgi:hypothetical protein